MSTAKTLDLPAPSDQPATIRAEIRGRVYTFTEMEIGEYDKLVTKSTKREPDPETGLEIEVVDNTLLMRLMIDKVVAPKPPNELLKTGTRMYRAFAKLVNELHYGDEPVRILSDTDDPEGKPSGNE